MEQDLSFFNKKTILITGGGGYLGSKLAEFLAKSNVFLHLLDISYNDIALELISKHSNLAKTCCDLNDKPSVEEVINKTQPDIIFHFGACLNRERDFLLYDKLYKVNVEGTFNLLEGLKKVNYTGFYFSSTGEVYGTKNKSPLSEKQIPFPASPYSLTKLMAENLITTYSCINNKPYTILRIFNFFGHQMPKTFFISQLEAALAKDIPFEMTKGEQKRDFLPVEELVKLISRTAQSTKSNNEIINLCSGKGTRMKELAERIAAKYNKTHLLRVGSLPYRDNEIWEMVGNNQKAVNLGLFDENYSAAL